MASVVAAVSHAGEDDRAPRSTSVLKIRQKADERGPSLRLVLAADRAVLFRRAHEIAGVSLSTTAEHAGVSQRLASYWSTDPHGHPVPLYGAAHPLVELVVGASLSAQAADALAQAERLDGDPEAITTALASLLHAVEVLHATLARRGL